MAFTSNAFPALPESEDIPVPPLATARVPELIFAAFIAATLNVPNPIISIISPVVAPTANTTELPDVTVTSVPFNNFEPFRYTSTKPAS